MYTHTKRNIVILAAVLLLVAIAGVTYWYFFNQQPKVESEEVQAATFDDGEIPFEVQSDINAYYGSRLTSENREEKITQLKRLLEVSESSEYGATTRQAAGTVVLGSSFDNGHSLSREVYKKGTSNREMFLYGWQTYQYTKESASETSHRLPILLSYLGLTFDYEEVTEEFVMKTLTNFFADPARGQSNYSKIASILYLAEKRGYQEVIKTFGGYNEMFEAAFEYRSPASQPLVAFMWLGALTDPEIGADTPEEKATAEELMQYFHSGDSTSMGSLINNLQYAYFVTPERQEIDSVNIINNILTQYPDFQYILDAWEKGVENW